MVPKLEHLSDRHLADEHLPWQYQVGHKFGFGHWQVHAAVPECSWVNLNWMRVTMRWTTLHSHLPRPARACRNSACVIGLQRIPHSLFAKIDAFVALTGPCVLAALDSMLMRFAKMSPEGQYTPPPPQNAKASYATLVYVRATIVEDAGWYLARATTIAVRQALLSPSLTLHLAAGPASQ